MTVREWVISKLLDDSPRIRPNPISRIDTVGAQGFVVHRKDLPSAYVASPASDSVLFTIRDFEDARSDVPGLGFVVLVRRRAANAVYPYADRAAIAVGPFSALRTALDTSANVGTFRSREQKYVQSRLDGNRYVLAWKRAGASAYAITRSLAPSTLTIVTFDQYEVTADQAYEMIADHRELGIDALVATNPSTRAFAPPASTAAQSSGVRLVTVAEFLRSLGDSWT